MPKNYIFILAHQDVVCSIYVLEKKIKEKKNIKIYYLTSGYKKKINKNNITKDKESLKILISGELKKKIFFYRKKIKIPIYILYKNLWRVLMI